MEVQPLTPQDMRLFITGRANRDVKKRVLLDLEKPDSYANRVLEGMQMAAKTMLTGRCPWFADLEADSATDRPPETIPRVPLGSPIE